jgi:diaminohydroxyphosphoribosylaminopyrimidine deaminase/5-amino-6-(5-phosphoribosylamino)uracil reductase
MSRDEVDTGFMRRALRLAERGRGRTSPNPIVGAVVVRRGRVVGEGWHRALGRAHAESMAIDRAGRGARGGTLYVTLEPCNHVGRTPPCVPAILDSGIRRCVVAVRDPHPLVNGRGLAALRRARVPVRLGVCATEARAALGGYWTSHRLGLPRVTWKVAATLDGRIADARGRSRWITGVEARRHGHGLRRAADAIVIGSGTARADDPRLTARGVGASRQPLRVVCDSRLSLPPSLRLFAPPLAAGTVVACLAGAPTSRARRLESRGVQVWRLPSERGHVSPRALARRLAALGRYEVLIEGGAAIGTSWAASGLVDRIVLYTAPRVLGGDGVAWLGPLGLPLERALGARVVASSRLGRDTVQMVDLLDGWTPRASRGRGERLVHRSR